MKREILFRGKRVDNGEWVYGFLWIDKWSQGEPTHIIDAEDYLAYKSTVGQYTGLTDKNGVKIFEGDIVSTDLSRLYIVVEFKNGAFMLQCEDNGWSFYDIFYSCADEQKENYPYGEVIGNIHDNPELIPSCQ